MWFGDFTRSLVVSTSTIIEGATMCVVKSKSDFNQTLREAQERSCRAGNIWCLNIRHYTEIKEFLYAAIRSGEQCIHLSAKNKNENVLLLQRYLLCTICALKKRERQEDFYWVMSDQAKLNQREQEETVSLV